MNTERKLFSERMGYEQPKSIQREDVDDDLRSSLWNIFHDCFKNKLLDRELIQDSRYDMHQMFYVIWTGFLKEPADEYQGLARTESFGNITDTENKDFAKKIFHSSPWFEVFNLVEFIILNSFDSGKTNFINGCNKVLEKENSAYRIINDVVTEITSKQAIEAIETASKIPYAPAGEHIAKALALLSDRESPDYENSIKESISAVESIAKEITGKEKSLTALTQELKLHPNFTKGLDELYNWSSKEFRHGTRGKPIKIDPDTARFMLVICSAFMSYIISKNPKK